MEQAMELATMEDINESICGLSINDGEVTEDGIHFYLSDGRILIIHGADAIYVVELDKAKLQ